MLKTIIVLPDGTELSSGIGTQNAIQNITVTECVNDTQELTLGSVCANMIELTAITPNGGFSVTQGDECTVYREDEKGSRHKVGLFTAEKPVRANANTLKVTAYDRISWLDKDMTDWIAGLTAWPYTLYDFANMTCEQCGLELLNTEIPNGNYPVQHFSAQGITGRQIMKWVGQIAGRFCRATVDGQIEFAWYKPASVCIGAKEASVTCDGAGNVTVYCPGAKMELDDAGNATLTGENISLLDDGEGNVQIALPGTDDFLRYYQSGFSFSDYQVEPIQKVQLKASENDVGTVYPEDLLEDANTYIISGNYLLTASGADDLKIVAQTLYDQLKDVTYTPCKVNLPAGFQVCAGDIVSITDINGVTVTAYVMTKKQSGQRDTLECTGSPRRDSSWAVNEQSYEALHGKVLNLQMNVDGLRVENKDTAGKLASLSLDISGVSTTVQKQSGDIAGITQNVTQLQQDAEGLQVSVQSIQEDGVPKVRTETGFSFDRDGLHISKADSDMENTLDETGMYVRRHGEDILRANDDGVLAVDVTVRNYLVVGTHARFEDYPNNRTACFWV